MYLQLMHCQTDEDCFLIVFCLCECVLKLQWLPQPLKGMQTDTEIESASFTLKLLFETDS